MRHAEYDDGNGGNQGNNGIRVGNTECSFDFGAEYPGDGSCQENQQRDNAVQSPRDRFGFNFHALVQIRFEDDVHGEQHQRQNQQHHRQAELHPADEVQVQRFGGNHVRRRTDHGTQAANTGAVGDTEQDENVGFAFFFLVEVAHHTHCQRQHHRGSRSVTDPHRQEGGNGKQHQYGNFHIAAGQAQQADGDFTVETLHVQGGCKREASEEDVNRRVGETCHRFFDVHIREAEYNGKDRDHQRGNGNVYGFGKPKCRNENQQRNTFVGIDAVGEDVINAEADNSRDNSRQQSFKVGNRLLRTEKLDVLRMLSLILGV